MSLMSKSLQEEGTMKQGIVTILNSDCDGILTKSAASIRRTLSADMSSKRWLSQNGFSKKIEDLNKIRGQDDVWRSIQEKNNQKPAMWGSLLINQKSDGNLNNDAAPPYVHPMVKRSASTLSEKSLEICTESLGSETGSDVLASYPCSEFSSDGDEDCREKIVMQTDDCSYKGPNPFEDLHVAKYKNSPVRPFPPPLSSIGGGDGAVHMHSRRENGRLMLEAVSVPPRNFFQARRSGGRLVLSLIQSPCEEKLVEDEEDKVAEFEKVFDDMEEVDGDIDQEEDHDNGYFEEDEEEEEDIVGAAEENNATPERNLKPWLNGTVMKKLKAFGNKNPYVTAMEEDEDLVIPQSLPPPPRVASLIPTLAPPAAASLNAYEYFWRSKTNTVSAAATTTTTDLRNKIINGVKKENRDNLVVMRGNKGECTFVPYLKGCKEPRRSLFWEPHCIATS